MKKNLRPPIWLLIILILPPLESHARSQGKRSNLPGTKRLQRTARNIQIHNDKNDLPFENRIDLFTSTQADTYLLAEFEFNTNWNPDYQGWTSVDLTAQINTFFHVDDFAGLNGGDFGRLTPLQGQKSLWCGAGSTANEPLCSYSCLPGYGNSWMQSFESGSFPVLGDVSISYEIRWDTEPNYDFVYVNYLGTNGTWRQVNVNGVGYYDGTGEASETYTINSNAIGGDLELRFMFISDGAWSDEDCLYDSDGAVIIDSLAIVDSTGIIYFQDFENAPIGARRTLDGKWSALAGPSFGDYSDLFPGMNVAQDDECTRDISFLWGFFKGSTYYYIWCPPITHPEQPVVPYSKKFGKYGTPSYLTLYCTNEIWSPWIEWNPGGTVPPTASSAVFDFRVYRDLPLDNLVFYVFHVRSKAGADDCPGPWMDRNFVYYGPQRDWLNVKQEIADLIEPGATHVQLALGCWDMCEYWCGYYSEIGCHTQAPLFDHVKLYRIDMNGPVWSVEEANLFQDNFPSDGTITGTVRMDMADDIASSISPDIRPGDSVVVTVSELNVGLGSDPTYGGAAVYAHVRSTGQESGASMSDATARFPLVSGPDAAGFYKFRMDTSYSDAGMTTPVPNEFCFDLNDNLFAPPDRVDFYFSATDPGGRTTYWSRFTGTVTSEAEVQTQPMEAQCLPTGDAEVLYVDDFDMRGAQPYFDTAFQILGLEVDRFDVRAPASLVGNGLGARATANQIVDVYKAIIWNSGDLAYGTIGDGSYPEKSRDAQLLCSFLDQTSASDPGLYITGDAIANEMKGRSSPLLSYINYNLVRSDHVAAGEPVSPLVTAMTPGTFFAHAAGPDTIIAYGGCPGGIQKFDVLTPTGNAELQMAYSGNSAHGAVISQSTVNSQAMTAKVVLEGFSYHFIRDDRVAYPPDRVDHLYHILAWFAVLPTSIGELDTPTFDNRLLQNYPNPFNPVTTIAFSLEERSHVGIRIYEVSGRLVRTLLNETRDAGMHRDVKWKGLNEAGEPVSSGVYFCRLVAGDFSDMKKIVLLR